MTAKAHSFPQNQGPPDEPALGRMVTDEGMILSAFRAFFYRTRQNQNDARGGFWRSVEQSTTLQRPV
jgi:hypothetical protein